MSPRPVLAPLEHGAVSVREVTGWSVTPPPAPFAATCRFRTADGRVVALRKFGNTAEAAEAALMELVEQRRRESTPSLHRTLREALDAFYAGPGPDRWSEATAATMAKARSHLEAAGDEPWPVTDARAVEMWGSGSRMDELTTRLLRAVRRT